MSENKPLGRAGVIGRFRPLHVGATIMLEHVCEQAEHAIIGIGSSNKYNLRNPFTPAEVKDMINLALKPRYNNYEIVEIPDFAQKEGYSNGQRWTEEMVRVYGQLDCFVSGNPWTRKLLEPHYKVVHPGDIIPKEKWYFCKGSIVRMMMARHEDWQSLVRPEVAEYMVSHGLVDRFRQKFGLQTIATLAHHQDYEQPEQLEAEAAHTREK